MLKRAGRRRKDFEGVELADLEVTRAVLHGRGSDKHTLLRKSLQTLLTGAVTTQRVRFLAGLSDSACCPFCNSGDENMFHLLWECQTWQHIRNDLCHLTLQPVRWPPVMRLCGYYVPSATASPPLAVWHEVQVVLARIIQARTQYLTRHEMFDVHEHVPEDVETPCPEPPVPAPAAPVSRDFPCSACSVFSCRLGGLSLWSRTARSSIVAMPWRTIGGVTCGTLSGAIGLRLRFILTPPPCLRSSPPRGLLLLVMPPLLVVLGCLPGLMAMCQFPVWCAPSKVLRADLLT